MRRLVFLTLILVFSAIAVQAQSTKQLSNNAQHRKSVLTQEGKKGSSAIPNRLYIRLKPTYSTALQSAENALNKAGVSLLTPLLLPSQSILAQKKIGIKPMQILSAERQSSILRAEEPLLRTFLVAFDDILTPEVKAAELMQSIDCIEYAEPKFPDIPFSAPNDPLIDAQTFLQTIKALEAWEVYRGNSETVIAIADNGVSQTHEDLSGALWVNTKEIPNNGIDDDGNGFIDDYNGYNFTFAEDGTLPGNTANPSNGGHGTHVAGLAGATANNGKGGIGTGFTCKIFPLKAGLTTETSISYGYEAILYAALMGFKVVNCSWGSDKYSITNKAIVDYALARDIAIVAAAGNRGNSDIFYPAGYAGVLGVGNSLPNDVVDAQSSYGVHARIFAPGEGTLSPDPNDSYSYFNGTSGASPLVAGAVALARAKNPTLSNVQAIEFVRQCTENIEAKNPTYIGYLAGRLNLLSVVSRAPFSAPSLSPLEWKFLNTRNIPVRRFTVGDTLNAAIDVKNYLGKATTLSFTFSVVGDDAQSITLLNTKQTRSAMESGEVFGLSAFRFIIAKQNFSPVFLRVDIQADGGYKDFFLYRFDQTLNLGFTTFSNSSLEFSLGDSAAFGFADGNARFPGVGFQLKPFGNLLYEGGLIASESDERTVSAVRGEFNSFDRDFSVIKPFVQPNENVGTVSDSNADAGKKIGIKVEQTVLLPQTGNIAKIVVRAVNTSGRTLSNIAVGYFFDWDIGAFGDSNRVRLFTEGIPAGLKGSAAIGICERSALYPFVICGAYSPNSGATAQFAGFDNNPNADGTPFGTAGSFLKMDKRRALTSGTQLQYAGEGDIGCVTGMLWNGAWAVGEGRTFVLLVGASMNKQQLADDMKKELAQIAVGIRDNEEFPEGISLNPQPANEGFVLKCSEYFTQNITLTLYSLLGESVKSVEFPPTNGRRFTGEISTRELPSGVYIARIQSGSYSKSMLVRIVR